MSFNILILIVKVIETDCRDLQVGDLLSLFVAINP